MTAQPNNRFAFCVVVVEFAANGNQAYYPIAYGIFSFFQLRGGGLFGPHPRKHSQDSLIDSKFGTANYWHKTMKSTKF